MRLRLRLGIGEPNPAFTEAPVYAASRDFLARCFSAHLPHMGRRQSGISWLNVVFFDALPALASVSSHTKRYSPTAVADDIW